jgi:hypothetical protein
MNVVQKDIIRVESGGRPYLVKWISAHDTAGQNELRVGRMFRKQALLPVPQLMFEKPVEGGVIAGWEWAEGVDLRMHRRDRLPEVFGWLGQLHRAMRNQGPVSAPPTGRKYPTAGKLLQAESLRLTALVDPPLRSQCTDLLGRLEIGYPTMIHGDMHPGNVIAGDDRVWFVDWGYACNSLNLFDLDYIHSVPMPDSQHFWAIIHPLEAGPVLAAYFEAAGLPSADALPVHRAVMVWNLLRSLENGLENGFASEVSRARRQLAHLFSPGGPRY